MSARAVFDWLKRRRDPSFEEQLRVFAECGIALRSDASREELLKSLGRAENEHTPWLLLACALGSELETERFDEPPRHRCDALWHFDTECIEDDGAYVRILERMAFLARPDLPIERVRDHVDVEEGEAWVEFELDGQVVRWEAEVNDDWVDATVLSRLAKLLEARNTGRRFTYIDTGGQDCILGCATEAQRAALAKATGLDVQWLR